MDNHDFDPNEFQKLMDSCPGLKSRFAKRCVPVFLHAAAGKAFHNGDGGSQAWLGGAVDVSEALFASGVESLEVIEETFENYVLSNNLQHIPWNDPNTNNIINVGDFEEETNKLLEN
jgi:hypothetical protein